MSIPKVQSGIPLGRPLLQDGNKVCYNTISPLSLTYVRFFIISPLSFTYQILPPTIIENKLVCEEIHQFWTNMWKCRKTSVNILDFFKFHEKGKEKKNNRKTINVWQEKLWKLGLHPAKNLLWMASLILISYPQSKIDKPQKMLAPYSSAAYKYMQKMKIIRKQIKLILFINYPNHSCIAKANTIISDIYQSIHNRF